MPKRPISLLTWSNEKKTYQLQSPEQQPQLLTTENEAAWFTWLETHSSFSFQGRSGRLSVLKEARARSEGYWYAYHTIAGHTHKRYLGRTPHVTLTRLEEVAHALSRQTASVAALSPAETQHHTGSAPMLPLTKFSHPQFPSSLVIREHLLTRLATVPDHRLTLLSASAGWGKTTLLSAWATQVAFPIAWLSLDELDNDPIHFWVSVLASLRARLPEIGVMAQAMLHSPQPSPLTTVLTALLNDLNDLNALTEPIILLLDDYHLIDEQAIHDSLLFLLEHLPTHLRLVLASRVDPPLALSRLRVRGQLLELRDADLRFLEEEAASFLTDTMGLTLKKSDVTRLAHRTEGWIAGLQLAALSLKHHKDPSAFVDNFTGSHRYLLDYVQEEILDRLPPPLQIFLLQISPLLCVTAPLCQAVTMATNSQELLETIERANLFLVPLDEEQRWYRMHDLFREVLLTRLQTTQSALIPQIHQRAAHWYEAQGMWRDAIMHALAGKDHAYAVLLMEQTAEKFWLCGETQTLYQWIMSLPEVEIRVHARFVLNATLYVLNASASSSTTQHEQAQTRVEHLMGRVEAVLGQQGPDTLEMAFLHQRLLLLRLWSEAIDDIPRGHREHFHLIEQRMQHLSREDEIIWQMIPLSITFILHWTLLGEGASLVQRFVDAKQRALQSGSHFAIIKVRQWLAGIYLRSGQLRLAHQECVTALDLIAQVDGYALLAGYFLYYRACILYQWNQINEARCVLTTLIHDAEIWQQIDLQIVGRLCLIDTELASGDHACAHQVLEQTQALIQRQGFSFHHLLLVSTQVRYWLATGDPLQAARWAARTTFSQDLWENERRGEVLMLVRVFLAQQQYQAARETLQRFNKYLDQQENIETATSFLALSVVALYQTGERERAQTLLARLLTLTVREENLRVFLDAGKYMCSPLQSLLNEEQNKMHPLDAEMRTFVARVLTAFEQEEQKQARQNTVQTAGTQGHENRAASASSVPALPEPLTHQERRVLHLLAAGQTYSEMAQTFIVSRNTIKTQVSSIYRKLGVSRRMEAIMLAQRLSLL